MIEDSVIKWDPKKNAFILTDTTYKNNILYIQNDPRKRETHKYFRTCLWLWNYLTHTREHLPSLYHPIYAATIQDHMVFVVVIEHKQLNYYRLDLRDKNKFWIALPTLTEHYMTRPICAPFFQTRYDSKITIVLQEKIVLFEPEYWGKRIINFQQGTNDPLLAVVSVGLKLYCFRHKSLTVYDLLYEKIERIIWMSEFGKVALRKHFCNACVKVYQKRFILIILDHDLELIILDHDLEGDAELKKCWLVAVYDCEYDVFIHAARERRYEYTLFQDTMYPEGIRNYLWHGDELCVMHCAISDRVYVPEDEHIERNLQTAITKKYHISYFIENWYILKCYILMRRLLETKRANISLSHKNTVEELLFSVESLDIFHYILSFLVCSDKNKYCVL